MSSSPNKEDSRKGKESPQKGLSAIGSTMSLPLNTLSSLLDLQDVEDHKPRLSKISWIPDILVFRSSILPIVLGPVVSVTLFSAGVAAASLWWGKEVGLTNNVVPLLSVVVGLLMVFRNSSAYERYAEGRKDFTALISNARNLSRNIWVAVCLPPATGSDSSIKPTMTRAQLTVEKKRLIRLVVAFVVATKHHLRAEGGVHHDDLKGLLPPRLAGNDIKRLQTVTILTDSLNGEEEQISSSPRSFSPSPSYQREHDEEASLGLNLASPSSLAHSRPSISPSASSQSHLDRQASHDLRTGLKRRPTAVRVVLPDRYTDEDYIETRSKLKLRKPPHDIDTRRVINERTPLIRAGVKPDPLTSNGVAKRAEIGLGKMVELGLPLIIAHEISRTIFRFRRTGCLEAVGPAGMNAMSALVQSMTDQLGSMERIVQTPLPYIFCIHLKQVVSLYLFILPFTLVDAMGWKMVFIMAAISMTFMGVEGIAAMIEQPFGTDPCDLNLDLYCTELLCECEAILERLPEGEDDDGDVPSYERCAEQVELDYGADDGGDE